ncbi:MAG: hypothetical protein ACU0CO_07605 [Shimia sp.]
MPERFTPREAPNYTTPFLWSFFGLLLFAGLVVLAVWGFATMVLAALGLDLAFQRLRRPD